MKQLSTKTESQIQPKMIEKDSIKIAMIIAFRDFRDAEYLIPRKALENARMTVTTVSTSWGSAIGADGHDVAVDILLDELNVKDFDAILFIGGPGALKYLDNPVAYRIANDTVKAGKILGAICIAPTILARAGVLNGKKATVWSSTLNKRPAKILKKNGAIYQDEPVIADGNIITANGPNAANQWASAIVKRLRD